MGADYDEDGRSERLLPCGYEPGDCSAAGFGCDGCGDNPANGDRFLAMPATLEQVDEARREAMKVYMTKKPAKREEYKCSACRDTGLGPYDGMRCPVCSPAGKRHHERTSGERGE